MNTKSQYPDLSFFKTPRKRRIFTFLYLILFGMVIGVMLTLYLNPSKNTPVTENITSDIVNAQTHSQLPLTPDLEYEQAVIKATQKAMPAVVSIHVIGTQLVYYSFRDPFLDMLYGKRLGRQPIRGIGSGVIIDPKGIIVTNDHVINFPNTEIQIKVVLPDGRTFPAQVIQHFPNQDIAIISVEGTDLPYIEIGSSSLVIPGQTVLAIGNPFGDELTGGLLGGEPTVTRGIVSATRRNITFSSEGITRYYRNMLQTDASINEGNSGGALIDLQGKLVGINTAIMSPKGAGSIGIGFAAPSDRVKLILDRVKEFGDIGKPYTGISVQDITSEIARTSGYKENEGVIINSVEKNSPGENSGFIVGDIITKVNGFRTTNTEDVQSMFMGSVPGENFVLTVFRNSKIIDVVLTLGSK
ncbi:MAG TPA: trypsin-like peptidase domain-containing protein [Anaerolineae bacterium]|nr:trypsin-like peptidase domain-containing protein [Anaerolineae bacterium]